MKDKTAGIQPLNGFRDFTPEDWKIQNYIFETWKKVCERYGYQEYNAPVLEYASIYNKSGDEVGTAGKEIYIFEDKGGRKVALRPEMTPSVGRMIAAYGKNYPKPIRWFSIAQFFRAERPQRGRGREFFQLNADVFGSESVESDFEVISLAVDIMLEFKATKEMFSVKINNRKFSEFYFENVLGVSDLETKRKLIKIIDASPKRGKDWLETELQKIDVKNIFSGVKKYLSLNIEDIKEFQGKNDGADNLIDIFERLSAAGISQYCEFDGAIARGFDYYTGMVFEVFDNNPLNNRSMFGGGRYDDLLEIFGKPRVPAVGFAPGDITTRLFLESWGLLEKLKGKSADTYYVPLLFENAIQTVYPIVQSLRSKNKRVIVGVELQGVSNALGVANKRGYSHVVILGEDEISAGKYKIKDMKKGEESVFHII